MGLTLRAFELEDIELDLSDVLLLLYDFWYDALFLLTKNPDDLSSLCCIDDVEFVRFLV